MLQNLSIRDVVLIDRLDLDLSAGLSALTGETGAGKSILLGCARPRPRRPRRKRAGAARAPGPGRRHRRVRRCADHPVFALLREQGLADDLAADPAPADRRRRPQPRLRQRPAGQRRPAAPHAANCWWRSRASSSSRACSMRANHRALLDAFGGLEGRRRSWRSSGARWRAAGTARAERRRRSLQARRDEEYLRHAVGELTAIEPKAGEEAELAETAPPADATARSCWRR